jgi:uncharacterized protein (TIGR02594 family)
MADNTDDLVISISTDTTTIKRALTKLVGDVDAASGQISRKFDSVGKSLDNSMTSALQARVNALVGIGTSATKEWSGALSDQGKQLDQLRAKYNPLFATITQYKKNISDIKTLYRSGVTDVNEYTAALSRERQATLANIAAQKGQNNPQPQPGNPNVRTYQTANIVAQLQDTFVSALGGQKASTIGFQQGTQLADVIQTMGNGKSVISGLGAAFASVVSPVSLITIGLVAGGAAAVQFGAKLLGSLNETKSLTDALADQEKVLKRIVDAYGSVAETAAKAGQAENKSLVDALGARSQAALKLSTSIEAGNFFSSKDVGSARSGGRFGQAQTQFVAAVPAFQDAINKLKADVKAGKADFDEFYLSIAQQVAIDPSLSKAADKIVSESEKLKQATDALKEYQRIRDAVFNDQGPNGRLLSQGKSSQADAGNLAAFEAEQRVAKSRSAQAFAAQTAGVNARSPYERANAARQAAAAQYNDSETPDARKQRIQQAGTMVQIQSQHDLAEAQRDRGVALSKLLTDEQTDINLIGKTGGEIAALRNEYQLTTQLRIDAAKNGTKVDESEIELIKQKSQELGKLTDAYNKANLKKDLSFERDQLFRTSQQQEVASRLQGAGQAVDFNSPLAKQIQQNQKIAEAQDTVKGFMTSFRDNIVKDGGNIGKAFGESVKDTFLNVLTKASDKAIESLTNSIVGALFNTGGSGGAGGAAAGAVGVAGKLFGGSTSAGSSGVSSVGSAVDKASSLLGSNESSPGQINSFLKAGGVDINAAQTAWCAGFVNSSLAQVGVKGSGSLTANSFLNWGSKIDPSQILKGDVLVQNRGLGTDQMGGHVGFATGATRMSGGAQQLQMLSGNSSNGVNNTWVNAMDVQARRATDASAALGKLAGSSGAATQGLDKIGQLSSSFFPAAPTGGGGGGGFGGFLSSIFGGAFKPNGAQATLAASGGIGLFADGGYTGPGGKHTPAGIVHAGEFVIPKNVVDKVGLPALGMMLKGYADGGLVTPVMAPTGPALASRNTSTAQGGGPGVLQVHITGANGDDHIRTLVKQGVGEGLNQYNDSQVRGGFGTNQNRWQARKG